MANLFTVLEATDTYVKVQKSTKEIDIIVELSTEFNPDMAPDTTSDFLDHMLQTMAWGCNISMGVEVKMGKWRSTHTLCEDVGITLGVAFKRFFYDRLQNKGVNIDGRGDHCLDEALSSVVIGVEGRRNCFIHPHPECTGAFTEDVEDLHNQDMYSFFEGFFQGMPATCHLDMIYGRDPHHVWETAFHALGEALNQCMSINTWRIASHNPYYGEEGIADASL